jgi:hypothetical protein
MKTMVKAVSALALMSAVTGYAISAHATVFSAWQVANVAWDDTLNVRKFPSPKSQKQAAYPNGTVLAMTGRCTDGVNLFDIETLPKWQKAQAVRYRWCEVWHDPARDGNYVTGWVYGRYIVPLEG